VAADEKTELDDAQQREILAFVAKLATATHFDVLGVSPAASAEQVRKAFLDLSRKYHPDRYFGKQLGDFRLKLDAIFRRVLEANQVMGNPERRAAYLEKLGVHSGGISESGLFADPSLPAPTVESPERAEERRARLSRHPYLAAQRHVTELVTRAREHLSKKEYSQAFTHLTKAAELAPASVEVKAMLADARRKSDQERSQNSFKAGLVAIERGDDAAAVFALKTSVQSDPSNAVAAFKLSVLLEKRGANPKEIISWAQKAVDAVPASVQYRVLLGRHLNAAGMKALAKQHFDEALKLDPDHPDVKKHVKKRWPF
jgi:curved DNA-binding protein CbpA